MGAVILAFRCDMGERPQGSAVLFPEVFSKETITMPRTIYALLVAIDDYPSRIGKLRGCVNDLDAFASGRKQEGNKDAASQ